MSKQNITKSNTGNSSNSSNKNNKAFKINEKKYSHYIEIPEINIYTVDITSLKPSTSPDLEGVMKYHESLTNNVLLPVEDYIVIINPSNKIIYNDTIYYFYKALKLKSIRVITANPLIETLLNLKVLHQFDIQLETSNIQKNPDEFPFIPASFEVVSNKVKSEIDRNALEVVETLSLTLAWNYHKQPSYNQILDSYLLPALKTNYKYYQSYNQKGLDLLYFQIEEDIKSSEIIQEHEENLKKHIRTLDMQRIEMVMAYETNIKELNQNLETTRVENDRLRSDQLRIKQSIKEFQKSKENILKEIQDLEIAKTNIIERKNQATKDALSNKEFTREISFDDDI